MRIVVTGGTGFIGSQVVERLHADGHELVLLARDPGKVPGLVGRDGIGFVTGALGDRGAARTALDGADALVHIARGSGATAVDAVQADTLPAAQLFEDAIDAGVRRIAYTSSIAVFDDSSDGARLTDESPQRPVNVYGATKAAAEAYLLGLATGQPARMNAIRPGYTFGEPAAAGAPTQSMPELPRIAQSAARGEPIRVERNAGLQFIWAGDLARVYAAVLETELTRKAYTALSPQFRSWEQLAHWAIELTGSSSEVVVEDRGRRPRRGPDDIPWDVSAIERDFGLRFDADDALRRHLAYWAQQS